MHRIPAIRAIALKYLFVTLACLTMTGCNTTRPTNADLAHDVYFSLKDKSPEAKQALVAGCYEILAPINGIVFLVAGTRDMELTREVNDVGYDVSLHVYFTDRAAHDAYQDDPAHVKFIEAFKDNWESVRVFDSTLTH